jgi:hypothetical protein
MKSITIKLSSKKEVIVTKLALGKYAQLLLALEELPKHLDTFSSASQNEIIAKLPAVIAASIKDFSKIIAISTDLSEEEILNELGLDDATQLVVAILEVNDYSEVWENLKKILSRPEKTAENNQKNLN